MLLPRISKPFHPKFLNSRCNSSISGKVAYPSKVRAYPFAVSLDETINYMGINASLYCGGRNIASSLAARFLPGFGFKPIQPARTIAVYLPTWIIDAELDAKVWSRLRTQEEAQQHTVTAWFQDSMMPGFVFDPLSRISLKSPSLQKYTTVPFSSELERQYEQDILCLPFTISPFSLPSLARSTSFKNAVISDDLRFDPTSVKEQMTAAYPILIPAYLLQYETQVDDEHQVDLTVIVEAYREKGNYVHNNVFKIWASAMSDIPASLTQFLRVIDDVDFMSRGPDAFPLMRVAEVRAVHGLPGRRARELQHWIDGLFLKEGAMPTYQDHWKDENPDGIVDWDDLRIRECVPEEVNAVRSYMDLGVVEANLGDMVKNMAGVLSEAGMKTSASDGPAESKDRETAGQDKLPSPDSTSESQNERPGKAELQATPDSSADAKAPEASDTKSPSSKIEITTSKSPGTLQATLITKQGTDPVAEIAKHRQGNKPSWLTEWEERRRSQQQQKS
ncbi:unnamed protein product [Somion occarium]|uniref:Uncharacterized protein n=1 Tax=Somion occarium TaxID=3059160 RepID=A0ABP1EBZ7_9APHY